MKKVIVVSKTHLDLGFTDLAENIRKKYLDEFIPEAIDTAEAVNTDRPNFVWTTGSWLLKEELKHGKAENREKLVSALKKGYIAPHALPFTMHTELLDGDTVRYGLSLVDEIDNIRGRKTISAKMTDVPGHTKALIPYLAEKGIRLLHIGVNGASAMPDVPECFLWKYKDSEVVVIYSGEYGGAYKNEYVDDVLYFDHTLDNHGSGKKSAVLKNIKSVKLKYPGYEVIAGTLDDYAEKIWAVRDKLPVVTQEIGDSWIHGSAADPYKSAALRTLISLKNRWLSDGSLKRNDEYINLADNILCIAEHTCGMDVKIALGEYENYLKDDFTSARRKKPSYQKIEKSWQEQRLYIEKAVNGLSEEHKKQAQDELSVLLPKKPFDISAEKAEADKNYTVGDVKIAFNSYGGIKRLAKGNAVIIRDNSLPCVTYDSYNYSDYEYWFAHYSRNLEETAIWAKPDFGKPNIERIAKKYKSGRYDYSLKELSAHMAQDKAVFLAKLYIDEYFSENLGAPSVLEIKYTVDENGVTAEILWLNKSANRLPESTMFHIYPESKGIEFQKLEVKIDPYDIVKNGNRNISAVQNVTLDNAVVHNYHSPLVGIGNGKILRFDNVYSPLSDGLTYILHDNIWGTNFPLWYDDNAYFKFRIDIKHNYGLDSGLNS